MEQQKERSQIFPTILSYSNSLDVVAGVYPFVNDGLFKTTNGLGFCCWSRRNIFFKPFILHKGIDVAQKVLLNYRRVKSPADATRYLLIFKLWYNIYWKSMGVMKGAY